ncbi:hypothetical protein H6P81_016351 [Aristolochia fimbriata]|uniref:GDSL esterase/lipase n=1 Tax=Aristolochia fimbriata TaxID=158543 RepID=A0AAV7E9C6_ARIFI|nr:hypothetical protein H6P81_016351 [Aristolochia fimbriata]
MMRMSFVVACVMVASVLAVVGAESPVTFVFGDSLTDVGNNNHLQYSLAKSDFPWYGIDYTNGQPTGRFTNGRTIGDIISSKIGIPSPPPYLSLSASNDAILKGVNYASGGAGILNETGLYFIQRLSLDDQISCFQKTKLWIEARIGKKSANDLCNKAVYFIGIGANDYVNNFLQPFLADGQEYTHEEFVVLLTSTLEKQLLMLYELGARKMIFHGLGPLGCIPSQRAKSKTGGCLTRVNEWVKVFNSSVRKLLRSLNGKLPGAGFTFADTFGPVLDLILRPTSYGFRVSNTSCCNVDTTLGGLCLPNSKVCKNRREYVFWDAFHPSDAANEVIAGRLLADPQLRMQLGISGAEAPSPSPR